MPITDDLLNIIHDTAADIPTFNERLGPGADKGNGATQRFVFKVNEKVRKKWPAEVSINQPVMLNVGLDFDYYVRSEEAAVEIALGIRNPLSEYEKDVFKALLAKDAGLPIRRLILIGKIGSVRTRNMPGSKAIRDWAHDKHGILIEVHEIPSAMLED